MATIQEKVCRLALFDGAGLIGMGALSFLWGASHRDSLNLCIGLALITLGGIELRGRQWVRLGNPRATGWLVASQVGLMTVIIVYCLRSMAHPPVWTLSQLPEEMRLALENSPGASDLDIDGMLPSVLKLSYSLLMLVSVLYQGAMAIYYQRNVPRALASIPPPVPPPESILL